jgi:DNA-binding response OmpR family regulator
MVERKSFFMKLLLLEDDYTLGETLEEMLLEAGYQTDWVQNGEEVLEATFKNRYDLYIFDINVPKINGFDLLQELREADDNTPAIYISAMTDIVAISKGFSVGAQDYIVPPEKV